ncbi:VPDSG-CTERM sorting domain-containing protein [Pelagicoccus enzymogenes]|uniref:VPDSG-CTERM sorting domain-containing protein n=1 Tax=Pelagicoccus enzymogenes TaxID=2773457 RepID=UPI00280CAAAF|nr:VPDSG-CTERM sorting domain-containing protein [Pelagicoccus enzymogenes]MDQ8200499.1 VPDSG-CTERM sorting domain-containing protein [Pelagicoccus enzymogenes]
MKINKNTLLAAALIAAASLANSAQALILSTDTGSIISAPSSTAAHQTEANVQQGFNEKQGVTLISNLAVDGGSIAAGTKVDSHMIFLDTIGSQRITHLAKWIFDGKILGVMSDANGNLEAASNSLLGAVGTTYPGSFSARGFENSNDDWYSINGNELTVSMRVTSPSDWIRVVTQVPDASSTAILMGFSLLGLVGLRKRFAR